jgi:hypothetical protein
VFVFSWSPNQRYIAVWAQAALRGELFDEDQWSLYVFDREQSVLSEYCLVNSDFDQHPGSMLTITWSPDSRFLFTRLHTDTPSLIVEILTGKKFYLPLDIDLVTVAP